MRGCSAARAVRQNAEGQGAVTGNGSIKLVRDPGAVMDHTFEIRFLDPRVQATLSLSAKCVRRCCLIELLLIF
jgi:hypothetical protein